MQAISVLLSAKFQIAMRTNNQRNKNAARRNDELARRRDMIRPENLTKDMHNYIIRRENDARCFGAIGQS